tara:strand:- start:2396 stop:2677 length:282 start_codon:yes stop_codon:yes gene_type:complete
MSGFATTTTTQTNKSSLNQHLKIKPHINKFGKRAHHMGVEDLWIDWYKDPIGKNEDDQVSSEDIFTPYKDGNEWELYTNYQEADTDDWNNPLS